jgi:hypothetical protein
VRATLSSWWATFVLTELSVHSCKVWVAQSFECDAAEADVVLLGAGSSAGSAIDVQLPDASPHGTEATCQSFRVAGSPFTPKFYGSFQLQDERHAGTQFAFLLTWICMSCGGGLETHFPLNHVITLICRLAVATADSEG